VIGYGAPNKQGPSATHGAALGKAEVEAARTELGLDPKEFTIPADVREAWLKAGGRGAAERAAWEKRLPKSGKAEDFRRRMAGERRALACALLRRLVETRPPSPPARRREMALEVIKRAVPATIGGSADLTGSNNTKTKATGR
jgi:transketolase